MKTIFKYLSSRLDAAVKIGLTIFVITALCLSIASPGSFACSGSCAQTNHNQTRDLITDEHEDTREHITEEFEKQRKWMMQDFFMKWIQPAMRAMGRQLMATGMQQAAAIGGFFDAKTQIETQRLIQQKTAQAHTDYRPSLGLCTLGTNIRNLAAASRKAETTAQIMGQYSQSRQLGKANTNASLGKEGDREGRLNLMKEHYCDTADDDGDLRDDEICKTKSRARVNNDIDYARMFGNPRTLNVDFTKPEPVGDPQGEAEADLLALMHNLYGHDVFTRPSETLVNINKNEDNYTDTRTIIAKRGVLENSFRTIAGMKSAGTEASEATSGHAKIILKHLGIEDEEAEAMLGKRPSYYALMEVLGQRIYQDPNFYTNLYDTPANVARKDAALQAINLVIDRDIYKSELRSEMLLTIMLELEAETLHDKTQGQLSSTLKGDRRN